MTDNMVHKVVKSSQGAGDTENTDFTAAQYRSCDEFGRFACKLSSESEAAKCHYSKLRDEF